jgi:hypothetical protein
MVFICDTVLWTMGTYTFGFGNCIINHIWHTHTGSNVITDWGICRVVSNEVFTQNPALVALLLSHALLVCGRWYYEL